MQRRDFLKAIGAVGAVTVGAGMLAGCSPQSKMAGTGDGKAVNADNVEWTDEADMVVVGGGGAGFCAAIEAAEAGSSVLILEKNSMCGGNTALCGGMMLTAGSPLQEELTGHKGDTAEAFTEQMLRWAQGFAEEDQITEMCQQAAGAADWMVSLGRTYDLCDPLPPIWALDDGFIDMPVPRALSCTGEADGLPTHFSILQKKLDTYDAVTVKTSVECNHLITDAEGLIVGVQSTDGDCFKAKKGVVLASASFDNNMEMAKALNPRQYWGLKRREMGLDHSICKDNPANTGDGIRMAMEVGADFTMSPAVFLVGEHYFGGISEYATAVGSPTGSNAYKTAKNEGSILVNNRGQRYVQEDADWAYVTATSADEILKTGWVDGKQESMVYILCDSDYYWQWESQGVTERVNATTIMSADSIEELAEVIGVPYDNSRETIDKWNSYCETGVDPDFDRRVDFGKIQTPPFYADIFKPAPLGTAGGVHANINCEVLDPQGEVIPRLYAAGMISSGSWIGRYYVGSGWAVLGTVVWGRKAGQNVAALDPWDAA